MTETAGDRLRARIVADVAPGIELDAIELEILDRCAATADAIELLEAAVLEHGVMIPGSTRNLVANPALAEARLQRVALAKLLREIGLEPEALTPAQMKGRAAANARWKAGR